MAKVEKEEPKVKKESKEVEDLAVEAPKGELTEEEAVEAAYMKLVQEENLRPVETPAEGKTGSDNAPGTLGDALSMAEDMTDLQYAMARMFPDKVTQNSAMVARIDPHVYIPTLHITSVNEIMMSDPFQPIDVDGIWMKNNVILSIGLDGRGRIDTAELVGAAREEKRAQNMLRIGNP